ncbi:hypothetical protein J4Q44_G00280190 [Coregonus suidteri]|uniref:Uncharacterized protein n=1 Tax=Coregonus suidteri TaxID=861788 RepID=A0AAN8LJF4_9TELE
MKMLQNGHCLSVITIIFTIESILTNVKGNDLESNEEPDATYALIGAGIGLFFAICFIGSKLYMIKKHMLDIEVSEVCVKRPCQQTALVDMKNLKRVSDT